MYLLSLRLPPSPWVGTRSSATAQYTVPSVSTQTVTPRRVGFLDCSVAPPRAEPAGPSVWCTMILRQGWALATSPHGASQTIFRPGISGMPDARAICPSSGVCAALEAEIAPAQSAVTSRRRFMFQRLARSRQLAQPPFRHCGFNDFGRERRRRIVDRVAVLAFL